MTEIILLNEKYEEAIRLPKTEVGTKSIVEFSVKNPFDYPIGVKCIPKDEDVKVKFCPTSLGKKESGRVILEYAPKIRRSIPLRGSPVVFEVTI